MAGKKDQVIVSVIAGVTKKQGANILADIMKSKNHHAPNARSTSASGSASHIGNLLVGGFKKLTGGK